MREKRAIDGAPMYRRRWHESIGSGRRSRWAAEQNRRWSAKTIAPNGQIRADMTHVTYEMTNEGEESHRWGANVPTEVAREHWIGKEVTLGSRTEQEMECQDNRTKRSNSCRHDTRDLRNDE